VFHSRLREFILIRMTRLWRPALFMPVALLSILIEARALDSFGPPVRETRPFVIYGDDDRLDLFEEPSALKRSMSRSVAALVDAAYVSRTDPTGYSIQMLSFGESYGLCPSEKFIEQNVAADCTAFLVAPDIMATAGHCLHGPEACSTLKVIFDFALTVRGPVPDRFTNEQVYSCSRLLTTTHTERTDFALFQLDRPVRDRPSLPLSRNGPPAKDSGIFVIGHPAGLPIKIAGNAHVRELGDGVFVTNLDTYAGSSGSPVINSSTFEVEGILVSGERDFEAEGECNVSYRCADGDCRGEDVTNISTIFPFLDKEDLPNEQIQNVRTTIYKRHPEFRARTIRR
jgi:hypothetical protein